MNLGEIKQVSKNTLVPLGLVISIVSTATGYGKLQERVEQIQAIQHRETKRNDFYFRAVARIDRRLYRLEKKNNVKDVEPVTTLEEKEDE